MKLAWFAPLDDNARSGVPRYVSELLLPLLRDHAEIELFSAREGEFRGERVRNFLSAYRRHESQRFDCCWYNLDDTRETYFARMHLGLIPGAVWFHDFFFTSDGPEPILNSSWSDTVRRYGGETFPWPAHDKEYRKEGALGLREAGLALLPIFSNPRDHSEYRRLVSTGLSIADGEKRSWLLPHPVSPELFSERPSGAPRAIVAYAGAPRIENRPHKVLQALAPFEGKVGLRWFLTAGTRVQAERWVREFGAGDVEIIEGGGPTAWAETVQGAALALHPRFSVFGQPSPHHAVSMALGVPTVVTRFGPSEELPDSVVIKVAPGTVEGAELSEIVRAATSGDLAPVGARGREYAREFHDARAIAEDLLSIIVNERGRLTALQGRWEKLEAAARAELQREALSFAGGAEQGAFLTPHFHDLGWL